MTRADTFSWFAREIQVSNETFSDFRLKFQTVLNYWDGSADLHVSENKSQADFSFCFDRSTWFFDPRLICKQKSELAPIREIENFGRFKKIKSPVILKKSAQKIP